MIIFSLPSEDVGAIATIEQALESNEIPYIPIPVSLDKNAIGAIGALDGRMFEFVIANEQVSMALDTIMAQIGWIACIDKTCNSFLTDSLDSTPEKHFYYNSDREAPLKLLKWPLICLGPADPPIQAPVTDDRHHGLEREKFHEGEQPRPYLPSTKTPQKKAAAKEPVGGKDPGPRPRLWPWTRLRYAIEPYLWGPTQPGCERITWIAPNGRPMHADIREIVPGAAKELEAGFRECARSAWSKRLNENRRNSSDVSPPPPATQAAGSQTSSSSPRLGMETYFSSSPKPGHKRITWFSPLGKPFHADAGDYPPGAAKQPEAFPEPGFWAPSPGASNQNMINCPPTVRLSGPSAAQSPTIRPTSHPDATHPLPYLMLCVSTREADAPPQPKAADL